MSIPADHETRMERATLALDGLSVADAVGETCFAAGSWQAIVNDAPNPAPPPWPWTDDTAMAIAVFEMLGEFGVIDQDALARRFADRHNAQPFRGYGAGARRLLEQIAGGIPWRLAARSVFPGGSYGNGSAMRIGPLAGYFAEDDYSVVAEQARLSAVVTHAHPEGVAGAVAVAVAGAFVWKNRDERANTRTRNELFDAVLDLTPKGEVRRGIEHAAILPPDLSIPAVTQLVGNGVRISCQDTVPFCLWVAAGHLADYRMALRLTVQGGGDIDTNCAIVGGIVAPATGREGIPAEWLAGREELLAG